MKETEESRERNSPEVYENGVRNTERHKHRNKVCRRRGYKVQMFQGRYESAINCWVLPVYSQSSAKRSMSMSSWVFEYRKTFFGGLKRLSMRLMHASSCHVK